MRSVGGSVAVLGSAVLALASSSGLWAQSTVPTVAGFTPGSFRVTESGAATYSVPIQVPPGIAGMEPKLALAYNSQGGNGLLGVGWHLEGLTAVGRCPRTLAQDGTRSGVNYDYNDRFCLDGQRLIAISGGYSADGTEYRTERESFAKIISYGAAGNGPAWFKVWTKSGQIMEYGNTEDSRIEAQGKTTAAVWALNNASDTKGNYFTVSYTEDNANGQFFPARIDYTGNTQTGAAPNMAVQFGYENRPDAAAKYVAGSKIDLRQRLKSIKTYQSGAALREYRLTYEVAPADGRSRVSNIQECTGDGSQCLRPTSLQWVDAGGGLTTGNSAVQTISGDWRAAYAVYPGDFNGDGITDLYLVGRHTNYAFWQIGSVPGATQASYFCPGPNLASASTITCVQTFVNDWLDYFGPPPEKYVGTSQPGGNAKNVGRAAFNGILVGDFNGDGISDLYLIGSQSRPTSYFCAGPGIASGNNCVPTVSEDWRSKYAPYVGDFNGDGYSDLVLFGSPASYFCAGPGIPSGNNCVPLVNNANWRDGYSSMGYMMWDPFDPRWSCCYSYLYVPKDTVFPGDFNGDGITDLVLVGSGQTLFCPGPFTSTATTNCTVLNSGQLWRDIYNIYPGDYNGDGITDLYLINASSGRFCPGSLLTSASTLSCVQTSSANWANHSVYPGDYNGDGVTDLFLVLPSASYFCPGPGIASTNNCVQVVSGDWRSPFLIYPGDYNGDGTTDLYLIGNAASYFAPGGAGQPDRLSSLTGGLGAITSLTYKPLTDAAAYTKGTGASYPQIDLQLPLYVVSSAATSNGIGGTLTTNFKYGGLKAEVGTGRGLLGFRWMEASSAETGIKVRNEFRQDFPYTGLVYQVKKTKPDGSLLSQADNTFGCTDLVSASDCTLALGRRYFPFVSQTVEQAKDWDGTVLPTVTTLSEYAESPQYGNVTRITVSTGDGHSKVTNNVYTNDVAKWCLGRLTSATVTSTAPDPPTAPPPQ